MIIRSPFADVETVEASLTEFVLGRADEWGDRPAVIEGLTGRTLSYGDLAGAVGRAAAGLNAHGVAKGDVLALCSPNCADFVIAFHAAASIGAVITTINPLSTAHEMACQLEHGGARWLVTTPGLLADKGPGVLSSAIREVFVFGDAPGATPFASLLEGPDSPVSDLATPDDVAILPFSSGTTGLPKGVVLTHRQLVASLCQMAPVHEVRAGDVVIAVLPLFHIYGMQVSMNLSLCRGATLITMPRFDLEGFLGIIEGYHVTRADLVPPIVLALAKHPAVDRYNLSSLRMVTSAAAPLGFDLAVACASRLGCRVKQAYGMTELGGGTHIAPETGRDDPESIGPAAPSVECRVIDCLTGEDVDPGELGELLVRSAASMRGYLKNPAATAATVDDEGWVHTGDIVTVDADGWFRVVDRRKELIKYNGYQVAPAELEALLLTHPMVTDCAVIASPDEAAGEVPKAFCVVRAAVTAEELQAYVAERVAPYKKIRRLEFVDAIPKSASGKILRRVLVERERAVLAEQALGLVR